MLFFTSLTSGSHGPTSFSRPGAAAQQDNQPKNGYYTTGYYVEDVLTGAPDGAPHPSVDGTSKYYTYSVATGAATLLTGLYNWSLGGNYWYDFTAYGSSNPTLLIGWQNVNLGYFGQKWYDFGSTGGEPDPVTGIARLNGGDYYDFGAEGTNNPTKLQGVQVLDFGGGKRYYNFGSGSTSLNYAQGILNVGCFNFDETQYYSGYWYFDGTGTNDPSLPTGYQVVDGKYYDFGQGTNNPALLVGVNFVNLGTGANYYDFGAGTDSPAYASGVLLYNDGVSGALYYNFNGDGATKSLMVETVQLDMGNGQKYYDFADGSSVLSYANGVGFSASETVFYIYANGDNTSSHPIGAQIYKGKYYLFNGDGLSHSLIQGLQLIDIGSGQKWYDFGANGTGTPVLFTGIRLTDLGYGTHFFDFGDSGTYAPPYASGIKLYNGTYYSFDGSGNGTQLTYVQNVDIGSGQKYYDFTGSGSGNPTLLVDVQWVDIGNSTHYYDFTAVGTSSPTFADGVYLLTYDDGAKYYYINSNSQPVRYNGSTDYASGIKLYNGTYYSFDGSGNGTQLTYVQNVDIGSGSGQKYYDFTGFGSGNPTLLVGVQYIDAYGVGVHYYDFTTSGSNNPSYPNGILKYGGKYYSFIGDGTGATLLTGLQNVDIGSGSGQKYYDFTGFGSGNPTLVTNARTANFGSGEYYYDFTPYGTSTPSIIENIYCGNLGSGSKCYNFGTGGTTAPTPLEGPYSQHLYKAGVDIGAYSSSQLRTGCNDEGTNNAVYVFYTGSLNSGDYVWTSANGAGNAVDAWYSYGTLSDGNTLYTVDNTGKVTGSSSCSSGGGNPSAGTILQSNVQNSININGSTYSNGTYNVIANGDGGTYNSYSYPAACTVFAEADTNNNYIADGSGGYTTVPKNGVTLATGTNYISIEGYNYENGTYSTTANGCGGYTTNNNYPSAGITIAASIPYVISLPCGNYQDGTYAYVTNGTGGYTTEYSYTYAWGTEICNDGTYSYKSNGSGGYYTE